MKKVFSLVLVLMLTLSVSACAGGQGGAEKSPSSADPEEYASWTKDMWMDANDKQQTEVVEKVFIELGEYAMDGYAEKFEKAKEDPEMKETMDDSITKMKDTIVQYFGKNPDSTIGEMIEGSKKAIEEEDLLGEEE